MDLQEFGNLLNQATSHQGLTGSASFPDKKKHGVFTDIKIRLRWILGIFAGSSLIFLPAIFLHPKTDSMFLLLYGILSVESIIASIAWVQIRAIETTTGNILQSLVDKIRGLHRLFRSYIYLNAFLYILLMVLIEYALHHPGYMNVQGFAELPFASRVFLYAAFIFFQWFSKRKAFEKHYGTYLNNLTKILDQTREEE